MSLYYSTPVLLSPIEFNYFENVNRTNITKTKMITRFPKITASLLHWLLTLAKYYCNFIEEYILFASPLCRIIIYERAPVVTYGLLLLQFKLYFIQLLGAIVCDLYFQNI